MRDFARTDALIRQGQADGVFPGAAISTGDGGGEVFRGFYGCRQYFPTAEVMTPETLFDVASMTKITATAMLALKLLENGRLRLSDSIGEFMPCPDVKKDITIWHLMTHTSGLPAHVELWKITESPENVTDVILGLDLLYKPGTGVTYSCLGFILLGKIIKKVYGSGLDILAKTLVFEPLGMDNAGYNPANRSTAAATEYSEDLGSYIKGVVHDENARFLGGVSGNAGVFATLDDCAVFARMLAGKGVYNGKPFIDGELFAESIKNHTQGLGEGRGLGFVVKDGLPSSAGNLFPDGSYGHTGYTGTSVWVDISTGQYVVFLTNRVHPTRLNDKLIEFRKAVHDACARDYRGL